MSYYAGEPKHVKHENAFSSLVFVVRHHGVGTKTIGSWNSQTEDRRGFDPLGKAKRARARHVSRRGHRIASPRSCTHGSPEDTHIDGIVRGHFNRTPGPTQGTSHTPIVAPLEQKGAVRARPSKCREADASSLLL